ncbi:MAG: tetratricopeptide repeat protein [Desulfobulbaceae bacterium]|jgi:tol-pal system protein YbgF|nr:tetratricopeptide repeat protein [Desulfobulbaceae bacterium]
MKKFPRFLLLTLPLLPLFAHCASYGEVERLQNQLRTMNRKMEDMKSTQVDSIQREQAAAGEKITQLEEQVRNLQNQLDDTNQVNSRLKEQNKSLEATIGARTQQELGKRDEAISKLEESLKAKDEKIISLEDKLKAQQDNIKLIQSQRVGDTEKALKEAQAKAEAAKAKAKALSASSSASASSGGEIKKITSGPAKIVSRTPVVPVVSVSPKKPTTTAQTSDDDPFDKIPPPAATKPATTTSAAEPAVSGDKLAEGKQLFAQKQYSKAQAAFESYLASNPSASQASEANYMIGECNFQSKKYDQAIISYQQVASKPQMSKAAAATLKQGMAFEEIADVEMAKTLYKKLIDQHPDSPEAKTARARLGKL